jgi:hypothetical protein
MPSRIGASIRNSIAGVVSRGSPPLGHHGESPGSSAAAALRASARSPLTVSPEHGVVGGQAIHHRAAMLQAAVRGKQGRRRTDEITQRVAAQRLVAMELLASEMEYLAQLTELNETFVTPLARSLPKDTHASLFDEVAPLIAFHRSLVGMLENTFATARRGGDVKRLAPMLLGFIDELRPIYLRYASRWAADAAHQLRLVEAAAPDICGVPSAKGGRGSPATPRGGSSNLYSPFEWEVGGAEEGAEGGAEGGMSPRSPGGGGGGSSSGSSHLRSLLELPLGRLAAYDTSAVELQLGTRPDDPGAETVRWRPAF